MKFLRFPALLMALALCAGQMMTAQPVIDAEGDLVVGSLTVEPTAILELVANNKGFLVPRMTEVERDGIPAPADALMIFNTTTSEFNYWDPSTGQWEVFISSSNVMDYAWVLEGNNLDVAVDPLLQNAYDGTNGAFLGTTSADNAVIATTQPQDIEFWTDGTQRAILDALGHLYPAANDTYTLGTDDNRWSDVYVNGGSVHVGPGGGEAGGTELNVGYAGGIGSLNVDGGPAEIEITTAATDVNNNLDANAGVDVTGADLTVGGTNFVVDVATGAIDAPNGGHDFGTAGTDAQVVLIEGDPFNVGNYELIVDGDVQITGLLSLPALTPNSVLYTDAGGNVATDNPPFSYDEGTNTMTTENLVVQTLADMQGTVENTTGNLVLDDATDVTGVLDAQSTIVNTTAATPVTVDDDLLVNNTTTMVEEFDAQDFGNEIGAGNDQQQLVIQGDPGAIIGNTLAANPPEWDLVVIGDQVTTGLIKAGGSIFIDGFTGGNHQIVGNDELNVGTITPNDLSLSTNSATAVVVDGVTQDVNILNDADVDGALNVDGATTLQSTLDVDGITDLNSNLNVDGATDLNSTLNVDGAVTINNTINQLGGGQVTLTGNVDATSGLDVSGQDLTVDAGVSVEAPGSGHTFGTVAVDAQVVEILGDPFNVGNYELFVDGDVQVTGLLSLPGLGTNAVVYTDGSGNLSTDNPPFAYNDVTNTVTTENLVVTGTSDLQGAVSNSSGNNGGNVYINDNINVTGNMDVDGNLNADGNSTLNGDVDLGDNNADNITFNGQVDSHILPDADDVYDLGSNALRWRDVYVGPASVHIGTDLTTEMNLGYGANTGTINVDGGAAEVQINAAANMTTFDPDGDGILTAVIANNGILVNTGIGTDVRYTQAGVERNGGGIETFTFSNTGGDLDVNVNGSLTTTDDVVVGNDLVLTNVAGTISNSVGMVLIDDDVTVLNGGDLVFDAVGSVIANNAGDVVVQDNLTVAGNTDLWDNVDLGDTPADVITLNGTLTGAGSGHSLGTLATDANVLTINGTANTATAELTVNGDVQISGGLALTGLTPNGVMFVNAAGNLATETTAGDFYWDATNNRLGIGNGGVAPTEAIDVTGNIEATGTIQSGTSIIIDGTTPGNHNITATAGENLTITPTGGTLFSNAIVFNHGVGLFTVNPGAVTYNGPQMLMPGILDVNPGSLNYLSGLLTVNPGTMTYNGPQMLMPGLLDVNPGSLNYLSGLLTVNPGTMTYNGPQMLMPGVLDVNPGSLNYGGGAMSVDNVGNTTITGAFTGTNSGHSLGTAAVDANVLTINGDPNNVGQYELDVQGDVNVAGALSLPGLSPNSVIVTDAAGNLATDAELTYDGTTNVLDVRGTIVNGGGDVTVNDALDVTGVATFTAAIDAQSVIQNSMGDVVVADNLDVQNGLDVTTAPITSTAGLTVSGGGASITGGLNNNNGGITNAGAIAGATTINASGNITGASMTVTGLSGGGNQSLYVDNTGALQASNATAAQNATGIFAGQATIAAPNAGGTEAIADANVVAGSIIVVTRVSPAGGQLSHHISAVTAGVGFTVQFSAPVTAGDQINYTIINP